MNVRTATLPLKVEGVRALDGYRLSLTLSDGSVVERILEPMLHGPIFGPLRDPSLFRQVEVYFDTVKWRSGADICPSLLLWGTGPARERPDSPPPRLTIT